MAFTKETLKHFWEHIDFLKANKDDVISVDLTNSDTGIASKNIFDLIYPVGSYYWSKNSTSPNELFGGTWEQIKDRFVLAAGDVYDVGVTGGESSIVLNDAQARGSQRLYIQNDYGTESQEVLWTEFLQSFCICWKRNWTRFL